MPANLNLAHDADPMRDDHMELASLLARAGNGEEQAWDALVDRYAPLIWSICRRYRLAGADAQDVTQPKTRRCRTPRSAPSWACRSAASGPAGAAA